MSPAGVNTHSKRRAVDLYRCAVLAATLCGRFNPVSPSAECGEEVLDFSLLVVSVSVEPWSCVAHA